MAMQLQSVVHAMRVILIAVCLLLLMASLVMWPRSLFYLDHFRIPFAKGQFPLVRTVGGLPGGTVTGGYPCFNSVAGRFAIVGTGPHPGADSLSRLQEFSASSTQALRTQTVWFPLYYPTRPALLIPYWLLALVATIGLAGCFPSKAWGWLRQPRFNLGEILLATFAVAAFITTVRLLDHRDAVIVGEALALALVAWKTLTPKTATIQPRTRVEWAVGVVASAGVLATLAFAVFTHTGYRTFFEPIASL